MAITMPIDKTPKKHVSRFMPSNGKRPKELKKQNAAHRVKAMFDRLFSDTPFSFIILFVTLLIAWLPWSLAMFPFGGDYDTFIQLYWAQGYPAFDPGTGIGIEDQYIASDHHPYLDTMIYGIFHDICEAVVYNGTMGLSFLAYLQLVLFAGELVVLLIWIVKIGSPSFVSLILFLFMALNPLVPLDLVYLCKETTSMLFLFPLLLFYIKAIRDITAKRKMSLSLVILLTIFSIFTILSKKTYIVVVGTVLVVLFALTMMKRDKKRKSHKKQKLANKTEHNVGITTGNVATENIEEGTIQKAIDENVKEKDSVKERKESFLSTNHGKIVSITLAVAIVVVLFQAVFLPLSHVKSGGIQEALAVPIQQVASVVAEYGVSPEEEQIIDNVIDIQVVKEDYSPDTPDQIKWAWKTDEAGKKATLKFLELWVKLGFEHPQAYLSSIGYLGNFFSFDNFALSDSLVSSKEFSREVDDNFLPGYDINNMTEKQNDVWESLQGSITQNQFCRLLLTCGLYTVVIPIISLLIMFLAKPRNIKYLIPIFIMWLTIFILPAFLPRYIYPFILLTPYIIGCPCIGICHENRYI